MTIRPLGPNVLVRRTPTPEGSKGGLYVLGRELPAHGLVLAIGPGPRDKYGDRHALADLAVGDEVTFDKWGADNRAFGEQGDLLILNYDELFLRIRSD